MQVSIESFEADKLLARFKYLSQISNWDHCNFTLILDCRVCTWRKRHEYKYNWLIGHDLNIIWLLFWYCTHNNIDNLLCYNYYVSILCHQIKFWMPFCSLPLFSLIVQLKVDLLRDVQLLVFVYCFFKDFVLQYLTWHANFIWLVFAGGLNSRKLDDL